VHLTQWRSHVFVVERDVTYDYLDATNFRLSKKAAKLVQVECVCAKTKQKQPSNHKQRDASKRASPLSAA
jgi:hypothetical protein